MMIIAITIKVMMVQVINKFLLIIDSTLLMLTKFSSDNLVIYLYSDLLILFNYNTN